MLAVRTSLRDGPMENGYIESSNGAFRDESLNKKCFADLRTCRP